jgi:hypothetical protein
MHKNDHFENNNPRDNNNSRFDFSQNSAIALNCRHLQPNIISSHYNPTRQIDLYKDIIIFTIYLIQRLSCYQLLLTKYKSANFGNLGSSVVCDLERKHDGGEKPPHTQQELNEKSIQCKILVLYMSYIDTLLVSLKTYYFTTFCRGNEQSFGKNSQNDQNCPTWANLSTSNDIHQESSHLEPDRIHLTPLLSGLISSNEGFSIEIVRQNVAEKDSFLTSENKFEVSKKQNPFESYLQAAIRASLDSQSVVTDTNEIGKQVVCYYAEYLVQLLLRNLLFILGNLFHYENL